MDTTKKAHPQLRQIESLFAAQGPLETAVLTSTPHSITMATRRRSQTPEVTIIEKSVERDLGCDIHGEQRRRDSLGGVSEKRESMGSLFNGPPVTAKNAPDKPTSLPNSSSAHIMPKPTDNQHNTHESTATYSSPTNGNVPNEPPNVAAAATPQRTFGLARKTAFPVSSVAAAAPTLTPQPVVRSSSAYSLNRAAQLRMRESADRDAAAALASNQHQRNGVANKSSSGVQRRQSFAGGRNSVAAEAAR